MVVALVWTSLDWEGEGLAGLVAEMLSIFVVSESVLGLGAAIVQASTLLQLKLPDIRILTIF